jgi:hypothetical protein
MRRKLPGRLQLSVQAPPQAQPRRCSGAGGAGADAAARARRHAGPAGGDRAGAAVQPDGLPDHVRHRLRAALLWRRLRLAGQVVPAWPAAVVRLPRRLARHRRRVVEGHRPVVGPGGGQPALRRAPDGRAERLGVWRLGGRVNSKDGRRAPGGEPQTESLLESSVAHRVAARRRRSVDD